MRLLRLLGCLLGSALLLIAAGTGETRGEGPASREAIHSPLFADENLLAWCIVPYDQRERSPAERIALLREEIIRLEAAMKSKQASKAAADLFFKS